MRPITQKSCVIFFADLDQGYGQKGVFDSGQRASASQQTGQDLDWSAQGQDRAVSTFGYHGAAIVVAVELVL